MVKIPTLEKKVSRETWYGMFEGRWKKEEEEAAKQAQPRTAGRGLGRRCYA